MKKLALHWKIIIGMILGVIYGLCANHLGFNYNERIKDDWRVITIRKK